MDMELGIVTNDVDASHHIAKGKRTKRLRHLSPCAVTAIATAISSSSSASEEEHGISGSDYGSFSSTTTATTFEGGTNQEEEDMANCLILLAQGKRGEENHNNKIREKSSTSSSSNNNNKNNPRFSEVPTTATAATKVGFYVYECKTCNRTFPSFQALGGHRASHKKPKLTPEEKKLQAQPQLLATALPIIAKCELEETKQGHVMTSPTPISLQLGCGGASDNNNRGIHGSNNKPKVHECSICGSEFTSGQALGGHMRRHRASIGTNSAQVVDIETSNCDNKPRNVLELDLNLPAPAEDDHRDSKFHFTATQKSMVLSAPALVGCHY